MIQCKYDFKYLNKEYIDSIPISTKIVYLSSNEITEDILEFEKYIFELENNLISMNEPLFIELNPLIILLIDNLEYFESYKQHFIKRIITRFNTVILKFFQEI